MTTSTRQILLIMNALAFSKADTDCSSNTSPAINPPLVPTPDMPRPQQEMGEVLANCLSSGKKPVNTLGS